MSQSSYDIDGFDAAGYDRSGFDYAGFDGDGYDRSGYDRDGYDRRGLDRHGYDRHGYDLEGVDRDGFDRRGYDLSGRYRSDSPAAMTPESARRPHGSDEVRVSRMVAGGVATVLVAALTAAVVCWLLQAVRVNVPERWWVSAGAPPLPDPLAAALVGGAAAAAAAAAALALSVFVAEGLRFFRIAAILVIAICIVMVSTERTLAVWLVNALTIGIPGMAIANLAPAVRPTMRP